MLLQSNTSITERCSRSANTWMRGPRGSLNWSIGDQGYAPFPFLAAAHEENSPTPNLPVGALAQPGSHTLLQKFILQKNKVLMFY